MVKLKINLNFFQILDTRDLTIYKIVDEATNAPLLYTLGEPTGPFGSKLEVDLPVSTNKELVPKRLRLVLSIPR